MTFYARADRGLVAHIPRQFIGDIARWMCGGSGQNPVALGYSPGEWRVCQSCDGGVLGPVVYRYFDGDGRCLYIGSTQNLDRRVFGHRRQPWWPHVARLTVEAHLSLDRARQAELTAIRTEPSLHNRQHGRAAA